MDCHNTLNSLDREKVAKLLLIPDHSKIKTNKVTDNLSGLEARQKLVSPEPVVGISYKQIKKLPTVKKRKMLNFVEGG